jgi:hypothetical protein
MKKIGLLLIILGSLAMACQASTPWHDGDLVFQTSRSGQSAAIQRATHSPYSHVGIVFLRDGKPYVFEAVATVRYTPLDAWIARGDGRFVVRRLNRPLSLDDDTRLRAAARAYEGRDYDLYFEWSNDRIYCSELVWKIYQQALGVKLGRLQKLREFDLADPLVKAKLRERYGDRVPLDEPVISPAAVFASPLLRSVEDH